jgi:NTE family protein
MAEQRMADLVLEGGGVKGIAHVGAVSALAEAGYTFHRVAGASAGAIGATFVAAGLPIERMELLMRPGADPNSIDYRRVPDTQHIHIPGVVGDAVSILFDKGIYDGDYLRDFINETLERETNGNITKFGDLRIEDADRRDLAPDQQYRLVVMVADVSRGSLVRLPWDYRLYGYDPDEMPIADAVRASTSIPFFFKPVRFPWQAPSANVSYWVDGGSLSDFPIEVFDRADDKRSRWPTFGVKLSARPDGDALMNVVGGTLSFAKAILETVVNGNDQVHLADPCVADRTVFVDTSMVQATDFTLTVDQQSQLFEAGRSAARAFLARWAENESAYRERCGASAARAAKARAARGETAPEQIQRLTALR